MHFQNNRKSTDSEHAHNQNQKAALQPKASLNCFESISCFLNTVPQRWVHSWHQCSIVCTHTNKSTVKRMEWLWAQCQHVGYTGWGSTGTVYIISSQFYVFALSEYKNCSGCSNILKNSFSLTFQYMHIYTHIANRLEMLFWVLLQGRPLISLGI